MVQSVPTAVHEAVACGWAVQVALVHDLAEWYSEPAASQHAVHEEALATSKLNRSLPLSTPLIHSQHMLDWSAGPCSGKQAPISVKTTRHAKKNLPSMSFSFCT